MTPRIPLPTDSIYKFYALSGIIFFITAVIMIYITQKNYNEQVYERYIPMQILSNKDVLNEKEELELEILKSKDKIEKDDRNIMMKLFSVVLSLAIICMMYGFFKWHTILQPSQNKLMELEIKKLEKELEE